MASDRAGDSHACGNIRGVTGEPWPVTRLPQCLQISHLPGSSEGIIQSIKLRTERSKGLLNICKRTQDTIAGHNSLWDYRKEGIPDS